MKRFRYQKIGEWSMKKKRVLRGFLMFCFTLMCVFGMITQSTAICQARERMIDIKGDFIGRDDGGDEPVKEFNIGARIEPEYFDVTAMILDTDTYDVREIKVDPDDLTVSPRYMQSERQDVTVRYRFNGTTMTLHFMIEAPDNKDLIRKRELLSISATYEGEPLSVGSSVSRQDIIVTARYETSYKTGKVSILEEELSSSDSWIMSTNVIEDGENTIIISFSYTDNYGDRPKTYRKSTTVTINSATVYGDWIKEGNSWRYRYDDDTYMISGWQKTGSRWYYLDEYGYMVTDMMMELDDVTYYFDKNGIMADRWAKYKNEWYYFNSDGAMQKDGWFYINGDWYYLKENGVMLTGWKYDKGKWYYLDKRDGNMLTGWVFDNVTWYYMDQSGAMTEGWIKWGDKWYYLDVGGAMKVNTWVGDYYVDKTGAWTLTRE